VQRKKMREKNMGKESQRAINIYKEETRKIRVSY
jgi:hypothetical protein